MKCFFRAVLIFLPFIAGAQDMAYTRYLVDTLAAPGMHGRGYVNSGDLKAAFFIAEEFRKQNLDSFSSGYFQSFDFPVNTFPDNMHLALNGKTLQPGSDYIVDPASASGKGKFTVMEVNTLPTTASLKKARGKFILIDKSTIPSKGAIDSLQQAWLEHENDLAGILFIEEKKLTWSVSTRQFGIPVIHILKKALPEKAKKISVDLEAIHIKKHNTQNVIGLIKGASYPDSFIVFSAHYDHLGRMGRDTYFPGANDNASGTAMMLNLVRYYSLPANKPSCSIVFIAFAGEEAGLIGSAYYTLHPLFPLTQIKFLVNMDLLGTGDDGMMVVNGDVYKSEFEILTAINDSMKYLKTIGKRGKAKNSDHYYFSENGVPCFFFYTLGGITAYHDIYDQAVTLPLTKFENVFKLLVDFVKALQ